MVSLSTVSRIVAQQELAPAELPDDLLEMVMQSPFASLSPREQQIASAVAAGQSNKEIARQLTISPWTVASHLRQIFAKLGVSKRLELCSLWHRAR